MTLVNEKLKKNTYYDALTGLPNRNLLADRMQHSIKVNKRKQSHIAINLLDLDGFKDINDLHGHSFGNEFVIILNELSSPDDCLSILQRTLDSVSAIRFIIHK